MKNDARQLEQLSAYIDGELSPAERADVEAMLARDASARTLMEELRQAVQLVGGLPRAAAPDRLAEEVTLRLEREALLGATSTDGARPAAFSAWRRGLAVAASLAIVVAAGWLMFPELPQANRSGEPMALVQESSPRTQVPDDAPEMLTMADRSRRGDSARYEKKSPLTQTPPPSGAAGSLADSDDEGRAAGARTRPAGIETSIAGTPASHDAPGSSNPASPISLGVEEATELRHSQEKREPLALRPSEQAEGNLSVTAGSNVAGGKDEREAGMAAAAAAVTREGQIKSTPTSPLALRPASVTSRPTTSRPATSQPTSQPATTQPATTQLK